MKWRGVEIILACHIIANSYSGRKAGLTGGESRKNDLLINQGDGSRYYSVVFTNLRMMLEDI